MIFVMIEIIDWLCKLYNIIRCFLSVDDLSY